MARYDEVKDPNNPISLSFTDEYGNETNLTAAEVIEAAEKSKDVQDRYLDESISYISNPQHGLLEIDIHPDDPHDIFNGLVNLANYGEGCAIRNGRYFVLSDVWMEENKTSGFEVDEVEALKNKELNGVILAFDENQVVGDELAPIPVTIR